MTPSDVLAAVCEYCQTDPLHLASRRNDLNGSPYAPDVARELFCLAAQELGFGMGDIGAEIGRNAVEVKEEILGVFWRRMPKVRTARLDAVARVVGMVEAKA